MSDPFASFSPEEPDLAPERRSARIARAALVAGAALVVVLGVAFYYVATKPAPETQAAPTSTTPWTPPQDVNEPRLGDCARVAGGMLDSTYTPVDCAAGAHNYVVGSLQRQGEDCGAASGSKKDNYARYRYSGRLGVCLVPVFADGRCYEFFTLKTDLAAVECTGVGLRVRVLANTADGAACGTDVRQALVYPETRTTYCFSRPT
ncbi:hypothetical protein AB0A63_16890 [Lentzea sp. NPDC042327]|uniref:LppU/SCO3897 family protein n=1 Tax=Lentzea sp. NPDC042327 TaxID=3154801 RepID=UPI0033CECBE2